VVAVVTLQNVREGANPKLFPRHALVGCNDALVLFAAAFYGKQDAVWIADAGLTATCVDIDEAKLEVMAAAYPDDWTFVTGDCFEFATVAGQQWDVVSIDCPSNEFGRCAELLPLWCLLARKVVLLGSGLLSQVVPPDGWLVTDTVHRSNYTGGVFWSVVERC
jgi:hypothetical protein